MVPAESSLVEAPFGDIDCIDSFPEAEEFPWVFAELVVRRDRVLAVEAPAGSEVRMALPRTPKRLAIVWRSTKRKMIAQTMYSTIRLRI